MISRLANLGKNLLLGLVSVAVAAGAAELAIRTFAPQTTLFPRFEVSDEYPIALPPNSKLVHSQGDRWRFVYTTNRLGKRGPYISPSEARDKQVVVVLGDSFTFGIGVSDENTYANVMREHLGDEYVVVNGGTGGWGLDSEIKWYYRQGRRYDPDTVILQFTANDPRDFSGVTTVASDSFQFRPDPSSKPGWQQFLSNSGFIQKSHLYSLSRKVYDRIGGANPARADNGSSGQAESGQQRYVKMLELFATELRKEGIELLFVSVTHPTETETGYAYDIGRFPTIEKVVTGLDSIGLLEFVELPLQEMQKHQGSPEGHQWGRIHHKIVGERISDAIVR